VEQNYILGYAEVVELADALRSGRSVRKDVRVQIPPSAFFIAGQPVWNTLLFLLIFPFF
jgi:hypothetical protein